MSEVEAITAKNFSTIPQAFAALVKMESELESASSYDEIRKIIRAAEAFQIMFAHVESVKHKAQHVVLFATCRINEELKRVPKANKHQSPSAREIEGGKESTGLKKNVRSRIGKLGAIPKEKLKTIHAVRIDGHDQKAILRALRKAQESHLRA